MAIWQHHLQVSGHFLKRIDYIFAAHTGVVYVYSQVGQVYERYTYVLMYVLTVMNHAS